MGDRGVRHVQHSTRVWNPTEVVYTITTTMVVRQHVAIIEIVFNLDDGLSGRQRGENNPPEGCEYVGLSSGREKSVTEEKWVEVEQRFAIIVYI